MQQTICKLAFVLATAATLCACSTTPTSNPVPHNASAHWKKGPFDITFQAGPHYRSERSFSYYKIERQSGHLSDPSSILVESAQDLGHFQFYPKLRPEDSINAVSSRTGRTLLISEEIENDCCPCTNYILVTVADDDCLAYEYLELPRKEMVPFKIEMGENPVISAVTDTTVTFHYSKGPAKTREFKAFIKKDKRPTFPG
ncbi:MAG: hypothetical protein K8R23_20365 [Chthoniobacter sp.]|nr:hypothetical protein [Chthoniobacter sp.]